MNDDLIHSPATSWGGRPQAAGGAFRDVPPVVPD